MKGAIITQNTEYLKFINTIEKKMCKEKIKLYHIYEQFNNINNCDIFELDNFEKNNMVPIVIIIEH